MGQTVSAQMVVEYIDAGWTEVAEIVQILFELLDKKPAYCQIASERVVCARWPLRANAGRPRRRSGSGRSPSRSRPLPPSGGIGAARIELRVGPAVAVPIEGVAGVRERVATIAAVRCQIEHIGGNIMKAFLCIACVLAVTSNATAGLSEESAETLLDQAGMICGTDWITFYAQSQYGPQPTPNKRERHTIRKEHVIGITADVVEQRYVVAAVPAQEELGDFDFFFLATNTYLPFILCLD